MITSPLLGNVRHRATITPVSPLSTRLIHIILSYWTIFYSFEIMLRKGTVHGIGFQSNVQIDCFKNIQSDMNYILKILHSPTARALMDEPEQRASERSRENACYE